MDKIVVYTRRACDDCVFSISDSGGCTISDSSGFFFDDDRIQYDEVNDEFSDYLKPCKYNLAYYDLEDMVNWFFETQKDKILYVDED